MPPVRLATLSVAVLVLVPSAQAAAQGTPQRPRPAALDAFLRSVRDSRQVDNAPVAPGAGSSGSSASSAPGVGASSAPGRVAAAPAGFCAATLADQASPGTCVSASSVPQLGSLYPLGPEFNVDASGRVGIGTTSPAHTLDVNGDVRVQGRFAAGNQATVGAQGATTDVIDLSARVGDFSGTDTWFLMRSYMTVDPAIDLTGTDATYVYSHDFLVETAPGNDRDIEYVQGPYLGAWHRGTGDLDIFGGSVTSAQSDGGTIGFQGATLLSSVGSGNAQIGLNAAVQVDASHYGFGGGIQDNYGLYVFQPVANSPIQNHYGLYLENQKSAQGDNYAIWSDGGDVYLRGNVGIGTLPTGYALQVGQLGDGSEARANAWNLLSSRAYKRDIEALGAEEYDDILAKIEAVDVVRYRYVDDDHVHLGVIAEESPAEILSRDGAGVSLGDYAAFLLAGLKAQQGELDTLRSELAELRRELAELRAR